MTLNLIKMIILSSAFGLVCNACSPLLRRSESVMYIPRDDIETAIQRYESSGLAPKERGRGIAEFYAFRSVCTAQTVPVFDATQGAWVMAQEGAKGIPTLLLAGTLALPLCLAVDTATLPVKWIRTATIPEDDVQSALDDLSRARELGYDSDYWYSETMFRPPRLHLDRIELDRFSSE